MEKNKDSNSEEPFLVKKGRPKLPDEDRKAIIINVKYSKKEYDFLLKCSKKIGMNPRTYIREASLQFTNNKSNKREMRPEIELKTLMELNKIGNNINQISKAIHQGRTVFQEEIQEKISDLKTTLQQILSVINQ